MMVILENIKKYNHILEYNIIINKEWYTDCEEKTDITYRKSEICFVPFRNKITASNSTCRIDMYVHIEGIFPVFDEYSI
jgi:hypothetical protein